MSPKIDGRTKRFRVLRKFRWLLSNERVCWVSAWVVATLLSLAMVALKGVPAPAIHDEFAYLLGADTFASGRVTNPTHPMWQYFESFHIIQQPTYTCKYPPLQPLTLALGQILGHPIIGACLATGLAIGSLVWMLTGWLPRKWYWAAWLFAVLHPSIHLFWGQSYWGGAVALTGASMLIGALGKLTSKLEIHLSVIASAGVLVLANSRPFEGAVLTISVGLVLVWNVLQNSDWGFGRFFKRVLVPSLAVVGTGVALMLTYNSVVTGHALKMPYRVHEDAYGWTPLFLWQTAGEKPVYRHPVMEHFYVDDKLTVDSKFSTARKVVENKLQAAAATLSFYGGSMFLVALFGIPFLLAKPKFQMGALILVPVFLAGLGTPWNWPHYFAPAFPLLAVLLIVGVQQVWKLLANKALLRKGVVVVLPILFLIWVSGIVGLHSAIMLPTWAKQRAAVQTQLLTQPGKDLVIVRYKDTHNPNHEWVYNAADIDSAEIVWARELPEGESVALREFFAGRQIWVVDADADQVEPRPYDAEGVSKQTLN